MDREESGRNVGKGVGLGLIVGCGTLATGLVGGGTFTGGAIVGWGTGLG